MNDGSCVLTIKIMSGRTTSYIIEPMMAGLNILDEYSRECIAIPVKRKLNSIEGIAAVTELFSLRRVPSHIRSGNGGMRDELLNGEIF